MRFPFAGLVLTFAVNPIEFLLPMPSGLSMSRIAAAATTLGWLLRSEETRRLASRTGPLKIPKLTLLFGVACLGSILTNIDKGVDYQRYVSVVLSICLALLVEDLLVSPGKLRILFGIVGACYGVLGIWPVADYFGLILPGSNLLFNDEMSDTPRMSGFDINPNGQGISMNMAIFLLTALLASLRFKAFAVPILGLIGIAAMALLLAATRTHTVGLVMFYFAVFSLRLFGPKKGLSAFLLGAVVTTVLGAAVLARTPEHSKSRLTLFGEQRQESTVRRSDFTRLQRQKALTLLSDHLFFGVGLGNFINAKGFGQGVADAHDTFSATVGETGLIGLCGLTMIVWGTGRSLWKSLRRSQQAADLEVYYYSLFLLASLLAMIVQSLGGYIMFYQRLFWLVVGLAPVIERWACKQATVNPTIITTRQKESRQITDEDDLRKREWRKRSVY